MTAAVSTVALHAAAPAIVAMSPVALVGAFVGGGLVVAVLVVLLLRGRFGTTKERADLALREFEQDEVPSGARRHGTAVCFGHSGDFPQIRGAGALWLTDTEVEFALRTPKRRIRVPLRYLTGVEVSTSYTRPGFGTEQSDRPFLILTWTQGMAGVSVAWHVDDPDAWSADVRSLLP